MRINSSFTKATNKESEVIAHEKRINSETIPTSGTSSRIISTKTQHVSVNSEYINDNFIKLYF